MFGVLITFFNKIGRLLILEASNIKVSLLPVFKLKLFKLVVGILFFFTWAYATIMTRYSAVDTPVMLYLLLALVILLGVGVAFSSLGFYKKIVLYLSLLVVWMAFVTPPFDSPDEDNHFYRTLHIYDGHLKSPTKIEEALLTKSFEEMNKNKRLPLHKSEFHKIELDKTSQRIESVKVLWTSYNAFIFYLPSLIGVVIGDVIGLSMLGMLILARLVNGFTYIAIVLLTLKTTQNRFKWLFTGILTLPFFAFLAGTVNLDAISLALTCLAMAHYLKYVSTEMPQRKDFYLYLVLIVAVSLSKLPYILLLGLMLPLDKISNKTKSLSIGFGIGLTLFWFAQARTANTGMYIEADPIYKMLEVFKFSEIFRGYVYSILLDSVGVFEKVSFQWTSFTWLLYTWDNSEVIQYVNAGVMIFPAMFVQFLLPTRVSLPPKIRKWLGFIGCLLVVAVISVGFFMWSAKDRPDTAGSLQARYFIVPWMLFGMAGNLWSSLSNHSPSLTSIDVSSFLEKYTLVLSLVFFIQGAVGQLVRYYTGF